MTATTFRTMDVSDLGDDATPADLADFCRACEVRQSNTGGSDGDVTAWMWGDGDWASRVAEYLATA